MESIDIGVCRGIWGNRKCGWVSRQAICRSGGIATFWDVESIQCSSAWHLNGILVVNAVRTSDLADLCLINIYAPCNPRDKKELWGILNMVIDQNRDKLICLAGDFNAVRNEVERVGRSGCTNKREMEDFDKFIRDSNLIDLPLSGRSYTWYRPDGSCKSRLDHFLLNEEWISCYPTARLKGLPRSISDHYPIILEDGLIDWGPKPFRFSNAWLLHPSFKDSLISMWQNLNIGGRVDGGLGVKHLDLFNKSLLGKWAWRIRVEPNSLWVRILDSKYGACSTFLSSSCVNRKYMSGWWREIFDLFFSTSKCPWFEVNSCKKMGNGMSTYFWYDKWVGESSLRESFPRLYSLCTNKEVKVGESGCWVDDIWQWSLSWRRDLRSWEMDSVAQLWYSLESVHLQVPATSILSEDTYKALSRIWNKLTPSKFSGLAWRILRCRLPTRSALKKRNILTDGDDLSCDLCGSYEETVHHLFFECSFSYQVWCRCYAWLMSPMACASDPTSHFLQHSGALGWKRKKHVMECIWSCAVWFLWKARNNKVFEHKEISLERTFEEIRIKAWCLFSTHYNCSFSLLDWCNNPRMCCH
ncbi:hypothetical protein ACS0TY_031453 [Phlomoides rotata]